VSEADRILQQILGARQDDALNPESERAGGKTSLPAGKARRDVQVVVKYEAAQITQARRALKRVAPELDIAQYLRAYIRGFALDSFFKLPAPASLEKAAARLSKPHPYVLRLSGDLKRAMKTRLAQLDMNASVLLRSALQMLIDGADEIPTLSQMAAERQRTYKDRKKRASGPYKN
jgi:hypothetical protein